MKKIMLTMVCLLFIFSVFALNDQINLVGSNVNDISLTRNTDEGISINYSVGHIGKVDIQTKNGEFTQLFIDGYSKGGNIGTPSLPMKRKIITVPLNAKIEYKINSEKIENISLLDEGVSNYLMPVQPSVRKDQDFESIPFYYDEQAYKRPSDNSLISFEELGVFRSLRLVAVDFMPVEYNPETFTLTVHNNFNVEIDFIGGDYWATENLKKKNSSYVYEPILENYVFNYREDSNLRENFTRYPIGYVIISDPMFEEQLSPFIQWKIEQGFKVTVAYTGTAEVGSTTASIKAYIQSLWDVASEVNPAPTYLLFVGDVGLIPAFVGTTDNEHITDLDYVKLEGNDYLPEMIYSRFSANTVEELQPQIDKTLLYEKMEMEDRSYLDDVTLIAGVDHNWASTHGNGFINYVTQEYINEEHGLSPNVYFYPESGGAVNSIIQTINDGVGLVNYTAHGNVQEWSEPHISNNALALLENENKYPLVVGNCCLTNKFQIETCFGEQWLRLENKGAIGYIGGTNSTYWNEDYYWGVGNRGTIVANPPAYNECGLGAYDGMFHEHNEPFSDWYTTAGTMILCGNLAVVESGSNRINYYWEIYSLMGEPSLSPCIGLPTINNANIPGQIFLGQTTVNIFAEPYSYVGISMDGVLHGSGLVGESGTLDLTIEPFVNPGTAKIVVTAQNKIPIINNVIVAPNDGPYVIVDSFSFNDNNNILEYGDEATITVQMKNIGVEMSENVEMTISTDNEYVTIIDSTEILGSFDPDEVIMFEDAFSFQIAENIPNNCTINFNTVCVSGQETWSNIIHFTAYAPSLEIGDLHVNDSEANYNGTLDIGESSSLVIPIRNIGGASSPEISVQLTSESDNINIEVGNYTVSPIVSGGNSTVSIPISISDSAVNGEMVNFTFTVVGGNIININKNYSLYIGTIEEGFESGDFGSLNWEEASVNAWTVVEGQSHSGEYCVKSSLISNNSESVLTLNMELVAGTQISFWRKVSSEQSYDKLIFFMDDNQIAEWSGELGWEEMVYTIDSNVNSLTWKYTKDISQASGSDCAWIDDLSIGGGASILPIISVTSEDLNYGFIVINQTATKELIITNSGGGTLSGTITAPEGFSISNTRDYSVMKNGKLRNEIAYNINQNPQTFYLHFTPTEVKEYSGNLVITSNSQNAQTINLPVFGSGSSTANEHEIPAVTRLVSNYPNPFNPKTTIRFDLNKPTHVKIEIFNIKGQKVKTVTDKNYNAGIKHIDWNGEDEQGNQVSSGLYFYKMATDNKIDVKRMLLIK